MENKDNRLKEKRLALNKTQAEVAIAAGVMETSYQRYEYGTVLPNVVVAIRIAKVLNTTVEELFGD